MLDAYICTNSRSEKLSERNKGRVKRYLAQEVPIEVKPVNPKAYFKTEAQIEPKVKLWVRAKGYIGVCIYVYDAIKLNSEEGFFFPNYKVNKVIKIDYLNL